MPRYTFPKQRDLLKSVTDHLDAYGIDVDSLSADGEMYVLETSQEIPTEELEHLMIVEM